MKTRTLIVASLVLAISAALAVAQYGGNKGSKSDRPADTRSLEGKKAPDFALTTIDGQDIKLAEQKGNVVVLDFWATWCGPCKMAMPHLQELANNTELAQKGLKVYAVNLKEDEGKVKPFLEETKYTFTIPMDRDGKVAQSYKVQGIPTQVVIGRDGMIKKVFVGFDPNEGGKRLDQAVEQALRAKAPANAKGPATKPSSEG